ncbi:hypothetical protein ACQCQ1_25640, partial [Ralstonia pseudosolanacearum]
AAFSERALRAYQLSFGASLVAAVVNGLFGALTAWALVRYEFPGKAVINAVVDLPFALPTAVAGIALASLYAPTGWVGAKLAMVGIKAAYNPVGVVIALTFIGLPFVVRTLEPVLRETYGVIVYQEQVMQIAQILAGYSLGEADLLRRAMGKKKKEEMDLQKARFVSGAAEKGVPN